MKYPLKKYPLRNEYFHSRNAIERVFPLSSFHREEYYALHQGPDFGRLHFPLPDLLFQNQAALSPGNADDAQSFLHSANDQEYHAAILFPLLIAAFFCWRRALLAHAHLGSHQRFRKAE